MKFSKEITDYYILFLRKLGSILCIYVAAYLLKLKFFISVHALSKPLK